MFEPDIFVLDGNHSSTNIIWNDYPAPNGKITDAANLEDFQHLVFSHPADPENTVPGNDPDHDDSVCDTPTKSDKSGALREHITLILELII